jgi:hypothetical protein
VAKVRCYGIDRQMEMYKYVYIYANIYTCIHASTYIYTHIQIHIHFFVVFLRQDLTIQPRLVLNAPPSSCLCLPRAGITGEYLQSPHAVHVWLPRAGGQCWGEHLQLMTS